MSLSSVLVEDMGYGIMPYCNLPCQDLFKLLTVTTLYTTALEKAASLIESILQIIPSLMPINGQAMP
jgi:hypothetical protein